MNDFIIEYPDNKWIPGYEGSYSISPKGEVLSFKGKVPKLLKPAKKKQTDGYIGVRLYKDGIGRGICIHVLMAMTFIIGGEIPKGYQVDHINHDSFDNSIENLRVIPAHDNMSDADRSNSFKRKYVKEVANGNTFSSVCQAARLSDINPRTVSQHINGDMVDPKFLEIGYIEYMISRGVKKLI